MARRMLVSRMKVTIAVAVVTSALVAIGAHAGESPGIDAISAYAGTWKTETERLDTLFSKAAHEQTMLRNECWRSGEYYACNQFVDGDSKVLLVFTFHAADQSYTSYQIPADGGKAGMGKLRIEGNIWTFPWEVKDGDKTTYFRVVNVFVTPKKIEFRQEYSPDKMKWTVMARGLETRVSPEMAPQ